MGSEDMLEVITERVLKEYKKNSHDSVMGQKLNRHEPIDINGNKVSCWKEFICLKMGEFVKSIFSDVDVDVYLDGNNSTFEVSMTDEQQQIFNGKMYSLIKGLKLA